MAHVGLLVQPPLWKVLLLSREISLAPPFVFPCRKPLTAPVTHHTTLERLEKTTGTMGATVALSTISGTSKEIGVQLRTPTIPTQVL